MLFVTSPVCRYLSSVLTLLASLIQAVLPTEKLWGCGGAQFCVLQFLQIARGVENDASGGIWYRKDFLDGGRFG